MTQAKTKPKTYLVTGAASGVGRATATLLAGPDTTLFLTTRKNQEGLDRVADAAKASGATVYCMLADLAEEAGCRRLGAEISGQTDRLDGLALVAGFADKTPLEDLDLDRLLQSWHTMPGAFTTLVRDLLPLLKVANGNVVAVSSFVAHRFIGKNMAASAAAKGALEALVKSFAEHLAPDGINVNAVVPGFIQKDPGAHRAIGAGGFEEAKAGIPKGRLGTPEDVAAAIQFLISPGADYITGQLLPVDGGLTL